MHSYHDFVCMFQVSNLSRFSWRLVPDILSVKAVAFARNDFNSHHNSRDESVAYATHEEAPTILSDE